MGDTKIEWTEKVWNPVRGCTRVSPGCINCYAERMAARFSGPGLHSEGFAERTKAGARWTGKVELVVDKLAEPLSWRKPQLVFVNSMSDLFHERLSNEDIAAVFGVMAACPQHTFQVLTKRAERMAEWFRWAGSAALDLCACKADDALETLLPRKFRALAFAAGRGARIWPPPNAWLGTSVENQEFADERIDHLRACPAAVRYLSVEPMLGPVRPNLDGISWVICGGESGHGARPMHPQWPRDLRDQCVAAGVPFFFKQHGEWAPLRDLGAYQWHSTNQGPNGPARGWIEGSRGALFEGRTFETKHLPETIVRVGKKAAGRLLDGETWDEMPEPAHA